MALRNLAKKLRIPTSAAARLPSAPNPADFRFPSDPSAWRASVSRLESARDWYEFQRARYDDVTTELKNFRREVVWTERAANLFDLVYKDAYKLESRRLIGTDACALVVSTLVVASGKIG